MESGPPGETGAAVGLKRRGAARLEWTASPWLPAAGSIGVALVLAGAVLLAGASWGPPELWPLLLRQYWLIAAASVLTGLGLGKPLLAAAWRDLARWRITGPALVGLAMAAALICGTLVGLAHGSGNRLQTGLVSYALGCGIVAGSLLGRRLMSGPRVPLSGAAASRAQPVIVPPGAAIPFDGVVSEGRSEVDDGPTGGSLLGSLRVAGDIVRRGARNGDAPLTIEPLVEPRLSPPDFAPAPSFAPGFARRTGLVFVAMLAIAVIAALMRGGDAWARGETGLLAFAVAAPLSLALVRPLVYARACGLAASIGWRLNGTAAIESLAGVTALVCGRGGVLTKTGLDILALHPAVGVEPGELVAAAGSLAQSSQSVWARALLHYAVRRKMLLVPITRWSSEIDASDFGFRAVTGGGQQLIAGSREWIADRGIRTSLLEDEEREASSPGRRALWVAQLSPQPVLIGVIIAGERLKPGAAELCKNAKRFGLTGVLLDRRGVEGGAEVARYLGLRFVEDDAMARKAMATEWETVGLRPALAQHRGDPMPETPLGPRLLMGAGIAAPGRNAPPDGGWDAITGREDPRLILDLLRLAQATRRREGLGYLLAYGFSLPGIWAVATGGSPQILILAAFAGLFGVAVNAQFLGLVPWTATEIDEE